MESKQNNNFNVKVYYEPIRRNRFFVEFPDFININNFVVQACSLPKLKNGVWEPIVFYFINYINTSVAQSLYKLITSLEDITIENTYIFIYALDPTGVKVQRWNIQIEYIKDIDFGYFDNGDDTIQKPHMVIQPKNCDLVY